MDTQMTETLEAIYDKCVANEDNIITVVQEIQKEFGYIQEDVVHWFSERSNIPASKYYGVVNNKLTKNVFKIIIKRGGSMILQIYKAH